MVNGYLYKEILFSNKNKWNSHTCCHMDKGQTSEILYQMKEARHEITYIVQLNSYEMSGKGKSKETDNGCLEWERPGKIHCKQAFGVLKCSKTECW